MTQRRRCADAGLEDKTFRNCDTVEVTCQEVADALWDRVKPFVTPVFQARAGGMTLRVVADC